MRTVGITFDVERGNYPGIATHDERLIQAVETFTRERGIAKDRFEFQLLYGVRPELQRRLVDEGYRVRIYVPYGTHWAGYFYRRITERKENVFFALRSMLRSPTSRPMRSMPGGAPPIGGESKRTASSRPRSTIAPAAPVTRCSTPML